MPPIDFRSGGVTVRVEGTAEPGRDRLAPKQGGNQPGGWQFDFPHLYRKSGSSARFSDFAYDLRSLVARQSLPGYTLSIGRLSGEPEALAFRPGPQMARG